MGRQISVALQSHLDTGATTLCYLLRVIPVTPGFTGYGVTSLDRDVPYNDGDGSLVYSAAVGVQPSPVEFSSRMDVDNGEGMSLMPEFDIPVSEEDIRAGYYDFARFKLYMVNFEDLTQGHVTIQEGTIGRITIDDQGLSFIPEFRGLSAQLKQSVCEKDSLTCRATFGSQPAGSATPGPVERFPCGFNADALFVNEEVASVAEANRVFTVDGAGLSANELAGGLCTWLTGDNAGRSYEIESNTVGGQITLSYETAYPIVVTDTMKYRPGCNKQARDETAGCKFWWGTDWPLHFRGEPDIPIGDAGAMAVPFASGPESGGIVDDTGTE